MRYSLYRFSLNTFGYDLGEGGFSSLPLMVINWFQFVQYGLESIPFFGDLFAE